MCKATAFVEVARENRPVKTNSMVYTILSTHRSLIEGYSAKFDESAVGCKTKGRLKAVTTRLLCGLRRHKRLPKRLFFEHAGKREIWHSPEWTHGYNT